MLFLFSAVPVLRALWCLRHGVGASLVAWHIGSRQAPPIYLTRLPFAACSLGVATGCMCVDGREPGSWHTHIRVCCARGAASPNSTLARQPAVRRQPLGASAIWRGVQRERETEMRQRAHTRPYRLGWADLACSLSFVFARAACCLVTSRRHCDTRERSCVLSRRRPSWGYLAPAPKTTAHRGGDLAHACCCRCCSGQALWESN